MIRLELPVYEKIVHNSSIRMEHHSIKNLAWPEAADLIGEDVIYEFFRIRTTYEYFSHVRNIEHSDLVADSIMLISNGCVLDRHHESSKRAHFGT